VAFTTPATAVAGEILTAAFLNTYLRDNIAWMATDSPACRAYRTTNLIIGDVTESAITLDAERFDNAAVHSTGSNTSRFTVPAGAGGKYVCTGAISWEASAGGSYRACILRVNGTIRIGQINTAPSAGHGSDATVCAIYALAAADYVEMSGIHNSGGLLSAVTVANYSPEASIFWFRT
jgi:hypothetical protein